MDNPFKNASEETRGAVREFLEELRKNPKIKREPEDSMLQEYFKHVTIRKPVEYKPV
jgi:hypothetical protein